MTVQKAKSTKMGQLNLHDSSLRLHENAASHTKAYILHHKNEEPFWSDIYMNIIFKLPSFFFRVKTMEGR